MSLLIFFGSVWMCLVVCIVSHSSHLLEVEPRSNENGLEAYINALPSKSDGEIRNWTMHSCPELEPRLGLEDFRQALCSPPESLQPGEEGRVTGYHLDTVVVVVRHGETGPSYVIRDQAAIDCGVKHPKETQVLHDFQTHLKNRSRLLVPERKIYGRFPLYPVGNDCAINELISPGVVQHLRVGRLLHQAYIRRWKLVDRDYAFGDVRVHIPPSSRTYQSAMAFMHAFLPNLDGSRVPVIPALHAKDKWFCGMDEVCSCPALQMPLASLKRKQTEHYHSRPHIVELVDRLGPIVHPGMTEAVGPFKIIDSLLTYICRRTPLPCIPRTTNCVTEHDIEQLLVYLTQQAEDLVEDSELQQSAYLIVYGMLRQLLDYSSPADRTRPPRFVLFSGHGLTILYLQKALGLRPTATVPFASHLVFEMYSSKNPAPMRTQYIRVLYNGIDVTKKLTFCQDIKDQRKNVLCPIENFKKFVRRELLKPFNASTFDQACRTASENNLLL